MKVFEKFGGNYQSTAESPLITDDKIILTPCGYQTAMVALDRLTGKTLWRSETLRDSNYFGSPVIIKGKSKNYIYQSSKLYDFIVDPADGKIVWRDSRVSEAMVPQVINDKIYLPGEGKKGGTLFRWDEDLKKRNVIWTDTVKALIISGSAVINDKLFVSTLPRGIACIDMKTGQQISRYNRIRTCNFLAADNMLYCYEDGTARLYMFKVTPNGFELVSSFKTASGTGPAIAHLALANGVLYVRHGTSLMAYDLREPKG
jgi:outer membrane protein assembly factor BamB